MLPHYLIGESMLWHWPPAQTEGHADFPGVPQMLTDDVNNDLGVVVVHKLATDPLRNTNASASSMQNGGQVLL